MRNPLSLGAITLLTSLFIYLFYRTEKTVVNELMMMFLSFDAFSDARRSISKAIPLNEQIIYSMPGGLWVFCSTVLSKGLYIMIRDHKLGMAVAPILFAIGLEFCQLIHLTNGTFDPWDIGFSIMFWAIGYYGVQSRYGQQNILTPFSLNGFIWLGCFLSVYLAHVSS